MSFVHVVEAREGSFIVHKGWILCLNIVQEDVLHARVRTTGIVETEFR